MSHPPNDGGRFFVMQTITTLIARSALSHSTEAACLDHILTELWRMSADTKAKAMRAAMVAVIDAAIAAGKIDALVGKPFPSNRVPDEELAVAIIGVLVTRAAAGGARLAGPAARAAE
jgi:hypothetical protein